MPSPARLAALAITAVAILAPVPSAGAATLKEIQDHRYLDFTDRSGERNAVTIKRAGHDFVVRDSAAPIQASNGCVNSTPHVAVCRLDPADTYVFLTLGGGNDKADLSDIKISAREEGGPGEDVIRGTNTFDALDGGGGSDELYGRGGNDILEDGDKRATGGGKDKLVGGKALDIVEYGNRGSAALSVDLSAGKGIGGDTLDGIEEVQTGAGDDTVTGDDAGNSLFAAGGRNSLRGLGGDDVLTSAGGGELDGGADDDEIVVTRAGDSETSIACGDGDDFAKSFPADTLTDCEYAAAGAAYVGIGELSVRNGNTLRFPVICSRTDSCAATLELHHADGSLASSAEYEVNDDPSFVRFTLEDSDVQLLAQGADFTIRAPEDGKRGFTTFLKS